MIISGVFLMILACFFFLFVFPFFESHFLIGPDCRVSLTLCEARCDRTWEYKQLLRSKYQYIGTDLGILAEPRPPPIFRLPFFRFDPLNFAGSYLGCIDAYDSESRLIFSDFSRSTQISSWIYQILRILALFCRNFRKFLQNNAKIWKILKIQLKNCVDLEKC